MKYKIGDKVRIKSLDWYNEHKNETDDIECSNNIWFYREMSKFCGKVMTISHVGNDYYTMVEDLVGYWTDEMIEGLVEEKVSLKLTGKAIKNNEMVVSVSEYILPEGYIIKDENGIVINTNKIVLEKKKEYPKTFEECVHVLEGENRMSLEQMNTFRKLIDARNAYWKIAGDEMGLGKPWKPDYDSGVNKYGIICMNGVVQESNPTTNWERHLNKVLDFPTEEMRDAFKKNFDPDIEFCKEFL